MRVSIIRAVIWNRYYISIFLFPSVFLKSREQLILLFQILQRIFLPLNRLFETLNPHKPLHGFRSEAPDKSPRFYK